MKTMLILAGARSDIGKEYIEYFKGHRIIGITRGYLEGIENITCDLTKRNDSINIFEDKDFSDINKIILIHCIGEDVFECKNYPEITINDTINPLVYSTNINTLKNVCDALINKINQYKDLGKSISLSIVMFGALTDKYNIPFFTSFRESKTISRLYIENLTRKYDFVKGFVVNVSTVKSKLSIKCRPFADTTYWLNPKDVVDKSIDKILNQKQNFEEIEIFKFDPNYEQDYYLNNDKIFKKWMKEMYG